MRRSASVPARKQAESELRAATEQALESNRRLVATVAEMERKRSELVIVTEMGDILQSCLQTEEAYQIITACAARLFPRTCGAVYRPLSTLVELEAVSTWGEDLVAGPVISSEDCWGLTARPSPSDHRWRAAVPLSPRQGSGGVLDLVPAAPGPW